MKEYKLNWRYWFFFVLFLITLVFGCRAEYLFLTGQMLDENGEKLGFLWSLILAVVIASVLVFYLASFVNMLRLLLQNKGCGLKISDAGIENTAVVLQFLAFVLVLPVKYIPWKSVKYYSAADNTPYIRVDTKQVQAGFAAKIILKISGYNFCKGFVKPCVVSEDIECYLYKFATDTTLNRE